jgi:hypothetical protein
VPLPAKVETEAAEREAAAKRGRRRRSMGVERKMEDGREDERGMMGGCGSSTLGVLGSLFFVNGI